MNSKVVKIPKVLSIFTLAMINIAAIGSVKNWPFTAEYGFSSMFYFILAALIFFFPASLVSAELATSWPKKGGVYLWVKEAFGPKVGFVAVWLQWVNNLAYYPTILAFTAGTIAYIFDPTLSQNTLYTLLTVLILFWTATLANLFGMKTSGWVSNVGAICGTFIPGGIIIILGLIWFIGGSEIQIPLNIDAFIPNFSLKHMVFFTGVMLAFAGIEMSAVHALDVKNPQKDYPRAILLSASLILGLSILGVLSIAIVVPKDAISFTTGTMQAFSIFLGRYNLKIFVPLIALLMAVGLFGSVSTWIIGPSKGLLAAAEEGHLPKFFQKTNKHNAPAAVLLFQGLLTTIIALMFLLMPTINAGFWILTVMVAQLYLLMYILMFAAALRLRYKQPKVERPYKVPGGNLSMWIIASFGMVGAFFAFIIGFLPPAQIEVGNRFFYVTFLLGGTLVGVILPLFLSSSKRADRSKQPPSR